jgi:hypothetical protein
MRASASENENDEKKGLARADDSDGQIGACLMEDGGGGVGRRSRKRPLGPFDGIGTTAVLARALALLVVMVVGG